MEGFIATRNGDYAGVGTTLELFRFIAQESADKNHRLSALAEQLGRARLEALAASKAKSDFLATMSHEIRTPLNGVLGVTQLLQATTLDAEQAEFVRVIDDSGKILLRLLNDILDLSKIEAGKMELEVTPFRPSTLVRDAQTLWSGQAREKGIAFSIEADCDEDAQYEGDPVRIKQLLFNLISNGIKFTQSGSVAVRMQFLPLGRRRNVMRVEVVDTGCGIPDTALRELFSAFKQADVATNRLHGGTGLGLAICRRLAELMGGSVDVTSRPGEGSKFWFDIPLKSVTTAPQTVSAATCNTAPATVLPACNILVAEDNPTNQAVARGFLKLRAVCGLRGERTSRYRCGQAARLLADPHGYGNAGHGRPGRQPGDPVPRKPVRPHSDRRPDGQCRGSGRAALYRCRNGRLHHQADRSRRS